MYIYIYEMEYYSVIKKNYGVASFAAPCMVLEVITLSEVSQRKTNTVSIQSFSRV